jgi:hypothetical protein
MMLFLRIQACLDMTPCHGVKVPNFSKERYTFISFLSFPTPCILAVNHVVLFQLNAHNMLNTYIYHQLPPTCVGVCYTIFRDTTALLAQKLFVANII